MQVTIRLSPAEYERLTKEGEERGENLSETIRRKCAPSEDDE